MVLSSTFLTSSQLPSDGKTERKESREAGSAQAWKSLLLHFQACCSHLADRRAVVLGLQMAGERRVAKSPPCFRDNAI